MYGTVELGKENNMDGSGLNSNLQQTQQIVGQILGNAGRFVAWAPSGSADATKVVTTAG